MAGDAVRRGCTAVDMVLNTGALKSGDRRAVAEELRLFKQAAAGAVTKCILEVCFLTAVEIATACKLVAEAGIDFVKTSSGQFTFEVDQESVEIQGPFDHLPHSVLLWRGWLRRWRMEAKTDNWRIRVGHLRHQGSICESGCDRGPRRLSKGES